MIWKRDEAYEDGVDLMPVGRGGTDGAEDLDGGCEEKEISGTAGLERGKEAHHTTC